MEIDYKNHDKKEREKKGKKKIQANQNPAISRSRDTHPAVQRAPASETREPRKK